MFGRLSELAKKIDPEMVEQAINKVQDHFNKDDQGSNPNVAAPATQLAQATKRNGRKRALLIGINYIGQKGQLNGCINDVNNMKAFLQSHGYSDLRVMTDNDTGNLHPTKANMLEAFRWLVSGATADDSLFLHYSGHGANQKSTDNDEADGNDETLVPIDYLKAGVIVDDEIHDILVKPLPKGAKLTAVFDCCHSGSVMDLPFTYQPDGNNHILVRNNTKEALQAGFAAFQAFNKGDHMGGLKEAFRAIQLVSSGDKPQKQPKTLEEKKSPAEVLMFSGCMDTQTSADANIQGSATGAMSWALLKVLRENGQLSCAQLLALTRKELHGKFNQIPQMSTSHEMDVTTLPFYI